MHEQRRRSQQTDPPEAQQAVELVIKLRADHGQQHDREEDAQQIVTKQQQENQRGHDQHAADDRLPHRHEHGEHQKADREVQLAVPDTLTGIDQLRRAADALVQKGAQAIEHPRERARKRAAAIRLLRIRLFKFVDRIHKHQKGLTMYVHLGFYVFLAYGSGKNKAL